MEQQQRRVEGVAVNLVDHYDGKRVFLTGHTGFKGRWLHTWLDMMGVEVRGYSLPSDVKDGTELFLAIDSFKPHYIFHLAAQPLVKVSYLKPKNTIETNVMGAVNLLEAIRISQLACHVVIVTTDKVYANHEWHYGYRETDPLGGHDPYSASKAAVEILVNAYRKSYLDAQGCRIATARAGNVIGGGDFSQYRIVPDCIRALQANVPIVLRNPNATRPWQHVLDCLSGYLTLGAYMPSGHDSFNFCGGLESNRTVGFLVAEIIKHWPGTIQYKEFLDVPDHEAGRLNLACDRAHHILGWKPKLKFEEAVALTVAGYRGETMQQQIQSYDCR